MFNFPMVAQSPYYMYGIQEKWAFDNWMHTIFLMFGREARMPIDNTFGRPPEN